MIGYKAFKQDKNGIYTDGMGNAKRIYWKVGERKKIDEKLELCKNGFHFFEYLCFAINYLEEDNIIYEVIIYGDIIRDTFKLCTNDIEIKRKVTKKELRKIIKNNLNSGNHNSGNYNSGNLNSGDCNSGNYNSGDCNSGNYNSGNYNSGYYNSGNCNSGNYNSGNYNSGGCNSGNYNSGYYNSGNYNSGGCNSGNGHLNYFCTKRKYFLFDIEVNKIPEKILNLDMSWFNLNNKTYKEAWNECPIDIINILKSIPEFNIKENKIKFKEITGIDLDKE